MLRRLHSVAGLVLTLGLCVTALSGAALSVQPMLAHWATPSPSQSVSVAQIAATVAARHPQLSDLKSMDDGALVASFTEVNGKAQEIIDPNTGSALGPYVRSPFWTWMIELHRSLFAGDAGRMTAGIAALAMVLFSSTGVLLLKRRAGGWSKLLQPIKGTVPQRIHSELGRLAVLGLILSALTGLWMTASTFGLINVESAALPMLNSAGGAPIPVANVTALQAVEMSALRDLQFPANGDPTDVYTLSTATGDAIIDQSTGKIIANQPLSWAGEAEQIVRMVHTGRGLWVLGLILGLSALAVPAFGVSGALIFAKRRRKTVADTASIPLGQANLVVLVGSEGGSTRTFARSLSAALTKVGFRVHMGEMNDLSPAHLAAKAMFILTSTYGDGEAPSSATRFLDRLAKLEGQCPIAVLGFGDDSFADFCGYARKVVSALQAKRWPMLLEPHTINQQSVEHFLRWGAALAERLGIELDFDYAPAKPVTSALMLTHRTIYGAETDTPTAVLRFKVPKGNAWGFEAGDLLAVYPPGDPTPRYYSLASSRSDGFVEICVRRFAGGLCSPYLHGLSIGETVQAALRENPAFHPVHGDVPLILIGAGAGIGPLAGFIRANDHHRPMHLYWGGRNPTSDFLYRDELADHIAAHRLTRLRTAFSRVSENRAYVQDRIQADSEHLRHLIASGAQILVCGGREMAHGVHQALQHIVYPLGTSLADLKSSGQYVEDVY